jgi:hypothetical protein
MCRLSVLLANSFIRLLAFFSVNLWEFCVIEPNPFV